jgi:hypothetical protein
MLILYTVYQMREEGDTTIVGEQYTGDLVLDMGITGGARLSHKWTKYLLKLRLKI